MEKFLRIFTTALIFFVVLGIEIFVAWLVIDANISTRQLNEFMLISQAMMFIPLLIALIIAAVSFGVIGGIAAFFAGMIWNIGSKDEPTPHAGNRRHKK